MYLVLRHDNLIKADVAGMDGVIPFMLMAAEPANSGNGNPGIDKYRIEQQIEPGFSAGSNLPQAGYREDILSDTDNSPHLHRQDSINDISIKWNVLINPAAEYEEGGNHEEIRLNEVDSAVQHL